MVAEDIWVHILLLGVVYPILIGLTEVISCMLVRPGREGVPPVEPGRTLLGVVCWEVGGAWDTAPPRRGPLL